MLTKQQQVEFLSSAVTDILESIEREAVKYAEYGKVIAYNGTDIAKVLRAQAIRIKCVLNRQKTDMAAEIIAIRIYSMGLNDLEGVQMDNCRNIATEILELGAVQI